MGTSSWDGWRESSRGIDVGAARNLATQLPDWRLGRVRKDDEPASVRTPSLAGLSIKQGLKARATVRTLDHRRQQLNRTSRGLKSIRVFGRGPYRRRALPYCNALMRARHWSQCEHVPGGCAGSGLGGGVGLGRIVHRLKCARGSKSVLVGVGRQPGGFVALDRHPLSKVPSASAR
jgi:hypothetical protein